jgi:hypothetical protein
MSVQMPTFLAFKDGVKINETVGANPQALNVCARSSSLPFHRSQFVSQKMIAQLAGVE